MEKTIELRREIIVLKNQLIRAQVARDYWKRRYSRMVKETIEVEGEKDAVTRS